ncbi:unnamed protein product [Amoebophrya sp. A25]|nr:unnamed protein product [Amoebophrya sp. A25]|eukprot:GSA25T00019500001.1
MSSASVIDDFLAGPLRSVTEAITAPIPFYGRRKIVDDCKYQIREGAQGGGPFSGDPSTRITKFVPANGGRDYMQHTPDPKASADSYYTQCGERAGPSPRLIPTDQQTKKFLKDINGSHWEEKRRRALLGEAPALPMEGTAASYYQHSPDVLAQALKEKVGGVEKSPHYPSDTSLGAPLIVIDSQSASIASTDIEDADKWFCKSPARWQEQKGDHPSFTFRDPIPGEMSVEMRDLANGAVHWSKTYRMNMSNRLDRWTPEVGEDVGEGDDEWSQTGMGRVGRGEKLPLRMGLQRGFWPVCPQREDMFHSYEITFRRLRPWREQFADKHCAVLEKKRRRKAALRALANAAGRGTSTGAQDEGSSAQNGDLLSGLSEADASTQNASSSSAQETPGEASPESVWLGFPNRDEAEDRENASTWNMEANDGDASSSASAADAGEDWETASSGDASSTSGTAGGADSSSSSGAAGAASTTFYPACSSSTTGTTRYSSTRIKSSSSRGRRPLPASLPMPSTGSIIGGYFFGDFKQNHLQLDSLLFAALQPVHRLYRQSGRALQSLVSGEGETTSTNSRRRAPSNSTRSSTTTASSSSTASTTRTSSSSFSSPIPGASPGASAGAAVDDEDEPHPECEENDSFTSDSNDVTDIIGKLVISEAHSTATPYDHTMM